MRQLVRRLLGEGAVFHVVRAQVMRVRRWRHGLRDVHPTFYMPAGARVSKDLKAGAYSFVNIGCMVGPKVELGEYVMFGPRVMVVGADHAIDVPGVPAIFAGRPELPVTRIEADAWIGAGAIIMAGVTIGRGAVASRS